MFGALARNKLVIVYSLLLLGTAVVMVNIVVWFLTPQQPFFQTGGTLEKVLEDPMAFAETELSVLAPDSDRVCFVPEYSSSKDFLRKNGIETDFDFYVSELETLMLFMTENQVSDYALLTLIEGQKRNRSYEANCSGVDGAKLIIEDSDTSFIFSIQPRS